MGLPKYIVGVVGAATAGAETAGTLAEHGITVVVFEQNARPYGKIEAGLPRWHVRLRQREYALINQKLDLPGVLFVPLTKIGRDIDFEELTHWGFTAIVLAHGAWRDRPLPVPGADEYVGRGLVYQNSFVYWFNHYLERDYAGPHYSVEDGAVVVGGGLASIDVMKILQLEVVRRELERRGIHEDALEMEHAGIPATLSRHGLSWQDLGLRGAALYYRRRIEDMPITDMPEDADPRRREQVGQVRRRIVKKAMEKYCFPVQAERNPVGLIVEGGRLAGLHFQRTRVENGELRSVPGAFEEVRAPLVVSSIGSIPEPLRGIPQRGEFYDYEEPEVGKLRGYRNVFSTGNVLTGKGNIAASRRHSSRVSEYLIEQFLGLRRSGHAGEEAIIDSIDTEARERADRMAKWVEHQPGLAPSVAESIFRRVGERQRQVGYHGSYREWIRRVTPPDLA